MIVGRLQLSDLQTVDLMSLDIKDVSATTGSELDVSPATDIPLSSAGTPQALNRQEDQARTVRSRASSGGASPRCAASAQ